MDEAKKVAQEEKRGRKDIINEKIFGKYKYLDSTDSKEGITNVKIDTQNIGNIPGLIDHWKKDIERRKKYILALKEQTLSQKMAFIFLKKQKGAFFDEASGQELFAFHPSKAAKGLLNKLQLDPADMLTRLELVSLIGKNGRDYPPETYRTLFLQAAVAVHLGELNNIALSVVLWTQDIYFSKLNRLSHGEVKTIESKIGPATDEESNVFAMQSHYLRRRVNQIKNNMTIIEGYQKSTKETLQHPPVVNASLKMSDIQEFILDKNRDDTKKKAMFQNASRIILILRHLPLLHEEGTKYLDILKRVDPHEPTLHLLHAKVNMSKLVFAVDQYRAGERGVDALELIRNRFKSTYHQYGIAVRKVGKMPVLPVDYTILVEYANLVHYFYRVSAHLLGMKLPIEWLTSVFSKAKEALLLAQDSGKVGSLYLEIMKDMADAGLEE